MATKSKRRAAPCNKCKGFSVPGRRVKTVARNAKGQFKRAGSKLTRMNAKR